MTNERKNDTPAHPELPAGVEIHVLTAHRDERGLVGEFFRESWVPELKLEQWCTLNSHHDTLRGMSVHLMHTDYLVLLQGHMFVGLRDLRPGSPTENLVTELNVAAHKNLSAMVIPPGVAHGFYFYQDSVCVLGADKYYNLDDELGCHWADPELGISWPQHTPIVCDRDSALGPMRDLKGAIPPYPTSA